MVEGFFKRNPIRVRALRILRMKENQVCSMLGSELMGERGHLSRSRIESRSTDHLAQMPRLILQSRRAGPTKSTGQCACLRIASASEPSRSRS